MRKITSVADVNLRYWMSPEDDEIALIRTAEGWPHHAHMMSRHQEALSALVQTLNDGLKEDHAQTL